MMNIKSHNITINDESWSVIYPDYCEPIANSHDLKTMMAFYTELSTQIQDSRTLDIIEFQAATYQSMINWKMNIISIGSLRFQDENFLLEAKVKSQAEETEKNYDLYCSELKSISHKGTRYFHQIKKQTHKYQLEDLLKGSQLEPSSNHYQELKNQLLIQINEYHQSIFEKFSDLALSWTAQFQVLRLYLLKFLAILPCLGHDRSGKEVKSILLENLRRLNKHNHSLPWYLRTSFKISHTISQVIPAVILSPLVKSAVRLLAKRFIAGETIQEAQAAIVHLKKTKRDLTIDQLGELVVSDSEADIYLNKVLAIIKGFGGYYPKGERNSAGILKAHVSIKVSALCAQFNHSDFDFTYQQIAPRLKKVLELASSEKVFINIDAEHYHSRDMIFSVYRKALKEVLQIGISCESGIVVQAYLSDAAKHLNDIKLMAKNLNYKVIIRLVKGAYWDAETIEASGHGYLPPQFINKVETDLFFRQLCLEVLKSSEQLQLTIASHNILDHCWVRSVWEQNFSHTPEIEHQCLHMTYEALSFSMAKMGWPTRNYIPVGDLLVGMAYLVRRIMENSSQVGVLQIMRSHQQANLLREPQAIFREKNIKGELSNYKEFLGIAGQFKNVTPMRSYLDHHHNQLTQRYKETFEQSTSCQLMSAQTSNPSHYRIITSPSNKKHTLGEVLFDDQYQISQKIDISHKSFNANDSWYQDFSIRARALISLAHKLLQDRIKLSAHISLEAGKSVEEALADVDEAIDFIHFYLREFNPESQAMGVVAVIAPWNFPLAIPCGMSVAALVAGNNVLLKPAEQTPLIMNLFHQMAIDAGVPSHAFQLIQGAAEQGEQIVSNPFIDSIVFTGSQSVGEYLYREKGLKFKNRHGLLRPVVVEMGGKNPIIVTNNCELDETVAGTLYSCFAHAGQKCSAASRIIVHKKVKDNFLKRFIPACQLLKIGAADDFSTYINPLISQEDLHRVQKQVETLIGEVQKVGGRVLLNNIDAYQGKLEGYYCGPVLVEIPAEAALKKEALFGQEFFAPVIHIVEYSNPEEAIKLANITEYALTAGLFCQSQDDIDYYTQKIEAGNIYVNRPSTGARVGIEPFGGFKMSGTGPKAGSVNYMELFYAPEKQVAQDNQDLIYKSENHPAIAPLIYELAMQMDAQHLDLVGLNEIYQSIIHKQNEDVNNVYVPDQLSFSQYRNTATSLHIILDEEKVDFEILSFIVSAIASSITLTIFYSESMSNYWSALNHPSIKLVKIESEKVNFTKVFDSQIMLITEKKFTEYKKQLNRQFKFFLPKVFIYSQGYRTNMSQVFLTQKSYAVNIMRHGAPLEENFDEL